MKIRQKQFDDLRGKIGMQWQKNDVRYGKLGVLRIQRITCTGIVMPFSFIFFIK